MKTSHLSGSAIAGLVAALGLHMFVPAPAMTAGPLAAPTASSSSPTFGSALRGAAPTGDSPATVAVDPGTHTAYVGNGYNANSPARPGGNTVSVVDTRRCRAADVRSCAGPWPAVTVGNEPSTLAVDTSTHTLYVTSTTDNTVSVVDGRTCNGQVTSGCDQTAYTVPVGAYPIGVIVDPRTKSVYVGNFEDATVSVFSAATCNGIHHDGCSTSPPASFAVDAPPGDFDINQRTHTAYVTTLAGLTAFDTRTCNATTQAGCGTTGAFSICPDGSCFGPYSAKVDPRSNTIYEGNGDNVIAAVDGRDCNADNLAGCENADVGLVVLPRAFFDHLIWMVLDSPGHTVYVVQQKNDSAVVIDTRICNATHLQGCGALEPKSIHTGMNPQGLALDQTTHTLYAANQISDSLSVIDTSTCNAHIGSGCRRRPSTADIPDAGVIAVDSSRGTAYVSSGNPFEDEHGSVAMLDTHRCNVSNPAGCRRASPTVPVDDFATAVAVDQAAHTLYVATANPDTQSSGNVSILDTRSCEASPSPSCAVLATIPFEERGPTSIAVNTKTHAVYVGATTPKDDSAVAVFNGSTCNATTTTGCDNALHEMTFGAPRGPSQACGGWYVGVAVNAVTNSVYATNTEACGGRGENVSVFDGSVCGATSHAGCGLPLAKVVAGQNPMDMAVDPATNTVYAALQADGEFASHAAVIDGVHCQAKNTSGCGAAPALVPTAFISSAVALDSAGHTVYVTNAGDTSVSAVDTRRCRASDTSGCSRAATALPVDDYPGGVALDPTVDTAYVTSGVKGTVSVVRLRLLRSRGRGPR